MANRARRRHRATLHPSVLSHTFVRLAKKAGLPQIRLHDLRHSYASAGLESGGASS
jgi:integrase